MKNDPFNYILRDSAYPESGLMELVFRDQVVELPATHFNSVSQLMREAFVDSKCQRELEAIMNGEIKADTLLGDGRFLECLPFTKGWGREGKLSQSGGMEFADGYEEDILVHPEHQDYILVQEAIDPGEDYTNFFFAKRDTKGHILLIQDTGTTYIEDAVAIAESQIKNGHREPILLPHVDEDPVSVTLAGGIKGRLSAKFPDGFPDPVWTCDVLTEQEEVYTSIDTMDPFFLLVLATDEKTLKQSIKEQKKEDDFNREYGGADVPF